MLAGVIDRDHDQFLYASAGATRPMTWAVDATEPTFGDNTGLPLGLTASADYENRTLPLPAGGKLFLYSDAAVELPVGNGILDEIGLEALVIQHMAEPDGQTLLLSLLTALTALGNFDDDLTALVVTRER